MRTDAPIGPKVGVRHKLAVEQKREAGRMPRKPEMIGLPRGAAHSAV